MKLEVTGCRDETLAGVEVVGCHAREAQWQPPDAGPHAGTPGTQVLIPTRLVGYHESP